MIIPIIRKITCIALDVRAALDPKGLLLRSSPLIVSRTFGRGHLMSTPVANALLIDSKQARDLVAVLTESKQQIDPRLAEMARYGGGGGSRFGGGGRGGGRGGRGGGYGGGGGYSGSNAAPMGGGRRW